MNFELLNRISGYVSSQKDALIKGISGLIAIPSIQQEPTADFPFGKPCFEALEKALSLAKDMGLYTEMYENVLGRASLRPGKADIGIWVHADVVPAGNGWEKPPFEPIYSEGKLYGRGATDNKAQLVGALYALLCIKALDIELGLNAAVFIGTNEENGMEDVKHWLAGNDEPALSLVPDAAYSVGYAEKGLLWVLLRMRHPIEGITGLCGGSAINAFPDKLELTVERSCVNETALERLHNTAYTFCEGLVTLTASGTGGHSTSGESTGSAFVILLKDVLEAALFSGDLVQKLKLIYEICTDVTGVPLGIACEDELTGKLHLAATMLRLEGGRPAISIDIRFPLSENAESLFEIIRETSRNSGFDATMLYSRAPGYSDPNAHWANLLDQTYNELAEYFSYPPRKKYTLSGSTYACLFKNGYSFGMNAGANAHGANEYVNIDKILFGITVYVMSLIMLDESGNL